MLREAVRTCSRADLTRAAKQLGLLDEGRIVADEDAIEMLADVALFEPNQRGRLGLPRSLLDPPSGDRPETCEATLMARGSSPQAAVPQGST